jgi:hypothetical protein
MVVARDGIEPPTPAFSGPRSTTELSGLGKKMQHKGRQVRLALVRFESPAWGRDLTAARLRMVFENVETQYSNDPRHAPNLQLLLVVICAVSSMLEHPANHRSYVLEKG